MDFEKLDLESIRIFCNIQPIEENKEHQQIRWELFVIICHYLVIYKLFVIICNYLSLFIHQ